MSPASSISPPKASWDSSPLCWASCVLWWKMTTSPHSNPLRLSPGQHLAMLTIIPGPKILVKNKKLQFAKNQEKKRKLGGSWWQTCPDKGNKFQIKFKRCESVLGFPCVAGTSFYRASLFLFLLQSSTSIKKPQAPIWLEGNRKTSWVTHSWWHSSIQKTKVPVPILLHTWWVTWRDQIRVEGLIKKQQFVLYASVIHSPLKSMERIPVVNSN